MQFSVDATRWQDFTRQLMQSRTTTAIQTFLSIVNDNAQVVIMICLSTIKTEQSPVNPRF